MNAAPSSIPRLAEIKLRRSIAPFQDFKASPVPDSMAAYLDYRERAVGFIEARNRRIAEWSVNRVS